MYFNAIFKAKHPVFINRHNVLVINLTYQQHLPASNFGHIDYRWWINSNLLMKWNNITSVHVSLTMCPMMTPSQTGLSLVMKQYSIFQDEWIRTMSESGRVRIHTNYLNMKGTVPRLMCLLQDQKRKFMDLSSLLNPEWHTAQLEEVKQNLIFQQDGAAPL